jgi:hypothetical protein
MKRAYPSGTTPSRGHRPAPRRSAVCAILLLALVVARTSELRAQEYQSHTFIAHPGALPPWTLRWAAGATLTILPRPVVEEELRQVPMLLGEARLGLPLHFSLTARAATNVLTTTGGVGAMWSLHVKRVAFAVGDEAAYWYGFATVDGFDLDAQGWLNYPSVSLGVAFDEFIVSLKAEAQLLTWQKTVAGSTEVQSKKNTLGGVAFTIAVEQPFWSDRYVKIGTKINYARQLYHAWLAFGTFKEFLAYPEFFVELVF